MADETNDVRDEAERLVASALAAAQFALRNAGRAASLAGTAQRLFGAAGSSDEDHAGSRTATGGPGWATGTPECCVCPVCRAIAAMRDPSPEFAAKVASGASDLAAGLTTILRAVSTATARPKPEPQPRPRPRDGGPTWRAATHEDGEDWSVPRPAPDVDDPWHAATTAPAPEPES